jgi:hypothetical protein
MGQTQERHWGFDDPQVSWGIASLEVYDHVISGFSCDLGEVYLGTTKHENSDRVEMDRSRAASALESLQDIEADAQKMGYTIPDAEVVKEASRILVDMIGYREASYDAYSMSGGKVAIGVDGGFGKSMMVVCESGGTALCVVTVNRASRRARYTDSGFLPDDFLRQGLREMVPVRDSSEVVSWL